MIKLCCAALGVIGVLGLPAMAQTAQQGASQTILTLSAAGSALAAPDEVVATLVVQVSARQAAGAAALANAAMAKALADCRAVPGVTAATSDYEQASVTDENGHVTGYTVSQTLNLTMKAPGGVPPPAFSALAGRLQAAGLLLNNLDGLLSPDAQRQARADAIADAIRRLQADAGSVASALGDTVQGIKTLSLDTDNQPPITPGRAVMMAAAVPATPPQSAPGPVTVTANITGDVVLARGAD